MIRYYCNSCRGFSNEKIYVRVKNFSMQYINLLQSVGFEKSCREDYLSDKRWVQREGCEDCIRLMDAEEYLQNIFNPLIIQQSGANSTVISNYGTINLDLSKNI